MKRIVLAALIALAVASCSKEADSKPTTTAPQQMEFRSGIQSRVEGNSWEQGDAISISVTDLNTSDLLSNNIEYRADNSGSVTSFTFAGYSLPIFFPLEPSFSLEIFACYPFIDNSRIMQINDQRDLGAIDYMEAELQIDQSSLDKPINFSFEHKHTLVKFNIEADESLGSSNILLFYIDNIKNRGIAGGLKSSISDNYGRISVQELKDGIDSKHKSVEMILFPTLSGKTENATIIIETYEKTYSVPFKVQLLSGRQQSYTIKIGSKEATIGNASILPWGGSDDPEIDIPADKQGRSM